MIALGILILFLSILLDVPLLIMKIFHADDE